MRRNKSKAEEDRPHPGTFRNEPEIIPHGEFVENLIRHALTEGGIDGGVDTIPLREDLRFPEIERLARSYEGHVFQSPRRVTAQLFAAAVDLERALFVVHPRLPAEAVADFWRSSQLREHLDACSESIERASAGEELPYDHLVYVQARWHIRQLLADHAKRVLRGGASVTLASVAKLEPAHSDHSIDGTCSDAQLSRERRCKNGRPVLRVDGKRVKELRGDLSQPAFARLCRVSVDAIQRIEVHNRTSEKTLRRVAKYLKIKADTLRKNQPQ